jgi:hypothetical protein
MTFASGKRLAILGILSVGLVACNTIGSSVADDDPETEVPNASLGRALMEGVGAVPQRKAAIDYSPRAPLVMPPSAKTLVPPEDPNKVVANANWPKDPDVETARALREAALAEKNGDRGPNIRLPASTATAVEVPKSRQESDREFAAALKKIKSGTDVYDENGQPHRRALVQPPVAYLEPSPDAPVVLEEPAQPKDQSTSIFGRLKFW